MQLVLWESQGKHSFHGDRGGPFSLFQGQLSGEVLMWLQQDPYFSSTAAAAGWTFEEGKWKDRRTENNKKMEIVGHLAAENTKIRNLTVNALDCSSPLFDRARALANAFKKVNTARLVSVQAEIRRALKALGKEELGLNGSSLLHASTCIHDWAFKCGSVQLMAPGARPDPLHHDGGDEAWVAGFENLSSLEPGCPKQSSQCSLVPVFF